MTHEEPLNPDADVADGPGRLQDLSLRLAYDSADEALRDFYVPALSRSVSYDRSVGYFRASSLSVASKGLSRFIASGGTARFLIGAEVGENERDALIGATEIPPTLAARLAEGLAGADEIAQRRLEVLAWLVKEGRLEIKVAVAVDSDGTPVLPGHEVPYFHEKLGVLRDRAGDGVVFQGSVNESMTGWALNFESFSVFRSWDATSAYFDLWVNKFEQRWRGDVAGFRVFPLPVAVEEALVALAPPEPPPDRDVEEPEERADRATLSRFLLAAPHLVGAQGLAEATSGVTLFPHQAKVAERLAGEYPRSWLVADEVGLGKTISAGVALRRLLLAGRVRRLLIMAPANVCIQWQDELFEKFGLWVPRLDGNRIRGAHPDDVDIVPAASNPYDDHDLLLASSHLTRLPAHQERILAATPYDLIVVDEAHHARRRGADLDEYRPSRLLQLLDRLTEADHTEAMWLLTATPMQIHPIELVDLLRQVGLSGAMESYDTFERFHAELTNEDDASTGWAYLGRTLEQTDLPPVNDADRALLSRIETRVGPVDRRRIEQFGTPGANSAELANDLGAAGRRQLRAWLRQRSPVGAFVTRHSRATLKQYRSQGVLKEPIADRDVAAVSVPFTAEESALYAELDGLLDRLMAAHGTKKGAGFVLTVYRRRLTSSWTAIRRTFERRLQRQVMDLELDLLDEAEEELDDGEGGTIEDAEAVPLTADDLAQVEQYIARLRTVTDSKFDALEDHLDEARGSGRAVIVFTQFTDTLDYLRDRLHPSYRSHLATYSGSGGRQWLEGEGWVGISKQDLVDRVRSGVVSVILATDAASEGLNLQAASYLISYDLPWNPMRVEQRIGRIDRIGQQHPVVTVRNYVIPGTVEESVYAALAERIDLFSGLVGQLQPILGATEDAFRKIFRTPRSERDLTQREVLDDLRSKVDEWERNGIELSDEDPLPPPEYPDPPVTLEELHTVLLQDLAVTLDEPGRPATLDPARVSRDPERWTSFGTFGHPRLSEVLETTARLPEPTRSPLVIRELGPLSIAYRADRTPPERVHRIADLLDLGSPIAAGDAEQAAGRDLSEAAEDAAHYQQQITLARRERWHRLLCRRFTLAVNRAIKAEAVLRLRSDGEPPDPQLVWLDLLQDPHQGWVNADLLRQHLEVDLAVLLPKGGPGADDRSDRDLHRVRTASGDEILALAHEWVAATTSAK